MLLIFLIIHIILTWPAINFFFLTLYTIYIFLLAMVFYIISRKDK